MPKGVYKHHPNQGFPVGYVSPNGFKKGHKGFPGNVFGKGKNLGNKNAFGKTRAEKNGNWKGGESLFYLSTKEKIAGRKRPENCELCGAMGKICFDHDHQTGKFRGWLCVRCNLVLGMVKDNIELLEKLKQYLNAF